MRKGNTIGYGQLRTQVGDHPADMMLLSAKMKTSFPALGVTLRPSLPLQE